MAFTPGNDENILQAADIKQVNAGAGNDKYILSANKLTAGQEITIADTAGANTLQLIGGLTIKSSVVAAGSVQLTLSNSAKVLIQGADRFSYEIGGNPFGTDTGSAAPGVVKTYAQFATSLGVATVPTDAATTVNGTADIRVKSDGTIGPIAPSFSVTGATAAAEGADASFGVSVADRVTGVADISVKVALAPTGTATAVDDFANALTLDAASVNAGITLNAGILTIPKASTVSSVTLKTAVATDSSSPEAGEGLSVTLSAPTGGAVLAAASTVTTAITDVPPIAGAGLNETVSGAKSLVATAGVVDTIKLADNPAAAYTLTIDKFSAYNTGTAVIQDRILVAAGNSLPSAVAGGVNNATDGKVDLTWVDVVNGNPVNVTISLTGVDTNTEMALQLNAVAGVFGTY